MQNQHLQMYQSFKEVWTILVDRRTAGLLIRYVFGVGSGLLLQLSAWAAASCPSSHFISPFNQHVESLYKNHMQNK
jgi:hypothetical protein